MAEPQVFHDYEFHFSSGELLCVTLLEGRDALQVPGDGTMVLKVSHEEGCEVETVVHLSKLNGTQITKRTVKDEAEDQARQQ